MMRKELLKQGAFLTLYERTKVFHLKQNFYPENPTKTQYRKTLLESFSPCTLFHRLSVSISFNYVADDKNYDDTGND